VRWLVFARVWILVLPPGFCMSLVPRTGTPAPWWNVSSELLALEAVDAGLDVRSVTFQDIEVLIRRSWWIVVRRVVERGHKLSVDFTTPVRRATNDVKREGEGLLRWLNSAYAHPATTPMPLRWSQNASWVVVSARFAAQWDAPGANLAVFSTSSGQGHIDKNRTSHLIRSLLQVNITRAGLQAEIVADVGSSRKRFVMDVNLFCGVAVERSQWSVAFIRGAGSMQMSKGVQIPELHFVLRKQHASVHLWPRLTVETETFFIRQREASGSVVLDTVQLRSTSVQTCKGVDTGSIHCRTLDMCVSSCAECASQPRLHSSGVRCSGVLENCAHINATFVDANLQQGIVEGFVQWTHEVGDCSDQAESFWLSWGRTATELLPTPPLANGTVPSLWFAGAFPRGAGYLVISAANEQGSVILGAVAVEDRVRPKPPLDLHFVDENQTKGVIRGIAEIASAQDSALLTYEIYLGQVDDQNNLTVLFDLGLLVSSSETSLLLPATFLPPGKVALVAIAVSSLGVRSHPTWSRVKDALPPKQPPRKVSTEERFSKLQTQAEEKRRRELKRTLLMMRPWPMKQEFANAPPSSPALRWAQNITHVSLVVRFSEQWHHAGADLSIFASGKAALIGRVDSSHMPKEFRNSVRVNVDNTTLGFEVAGRDDKLGLRRYVLNHSLFDEVLPQESKWSLFQHSLGNGPAELHVTLRRRWRCGSWPRLSRALVEEGGVVPEPLAQGLPESLSSTLPVVAESPRTCLGRKGSASYCGSLDSCVEQCALCPGQPVGEGRCCGSWQGVTPLSASFIDEDLRQGKIGGTVRWEAGFLDDAETLALCWGFEGDHGEEVLGELIFEVVAIGPSIEIPLGTTIPPNALFLVVKAKNRASESALVTAGFNDAVA